MKHSRNETKRIWQLLSRLNLKLRPKLILTFILVKVIPIVLLTVIAFTQINSLGSTLRDIAVEDSTVALNDGARDNIERMTTGLAAAVADFLHQRDQDILLLASLPLSDEILRAFSENRNSLLMRQGEWGLSEDGMTWVEREPFQPSAREFVSTNEENNDILLGSSFNYRPREFFPYFRELVPLYDEITFIDLYGNEIYKYVTSNSTKRHFPLNPNRVNVADRTNTYVRAETYFESLRNLRPGEIYVSRVIGAYVGTSFIGMFTPGALRNVPSTHPNFDILQGFAALPEEEFLEVARRQAFAGTENPIGQRFEGIVRWATPVTDENGEIIGFVTMALNHDHIMEFVDFVTPMNERYSVLSDAVDGNYAFIWDYKSRSIAHPRHHSIVGFNPLTGEPQLPWLEGTLAFERDYATGGFLRDEHGDRIPILEDGVHVPARDTPFYLWYSAGGAEWLAANPSWDNLSSEAAGVSWGEFLSRYEDDREILPQFGERILRDRDGNAARDADGNYILDRQSRDKNPARALTRAGFVGLDGRFLNNAPQCTGWMDLTERGGSGSFYILWSYIYKPTTAGAIPYYTGMYAPENRGGSLRGFGFVTIGSGIEDFTAPARATEQKLSAAIYLSMQDNLYGLGITSAILLVMIVMSAIFLSTYLTNTINFLLRGISRFRSGERQFRFHSDARDEFGTLSDSLDEMFNSIVNSTNNPLTIIDMDHKVVYMNEHALEILGKTLEEIIGLSYDTISIYPYGSKYCAITALLEDREAEVLFKKESGHYYKAKAKYLLDYAKNKSGYLIETNNVTEIEIARQKALQASRAKSDFLANMSHEIRTPLNAIIGMTSVGRSAADIEKKNYSMQRIHGASAHLLGVINDILDMSKIEANKFSLSVTEFTFDKLLQRVVDVINFRVDEKRQKLTVHIDPNIPPTLIGDDQRLAQVATNLLSNAVKFTPEEGSIHLEATLLSEQSGGICTLLFSVKDTGIGISEEQQSRLFTSFGQAESSTTRKYGGTGLGLAISKNIVEMMDGSIWVDSELDKGATFSFTACLVRGMDKSKLLISEANLENIRILAVDDDPEILDFFKIAAEHMDIHCDTAESGRDAISLMEKNGPYSLCFVDWNMPEMNGIELASAINEKHADNSVIIMMSAMEWSTIEDSATEAGVKKFLSKPLFISSIADCINECLRRQDPNYRELESAENFEGHCILLVEDVEINREIVLALLEPTNLEIDCATNGIEAVNAFVSNPLKYDMIFMDLQMPEMDGYTATKQIRESGAERAKDIPIVAMTANVFKEDVDRCLEAGMNAHIGKPLDMEEVLGALEEYLRKN